MSGDLDALIAAQNAAVLGGEDVRGVLSAYQARHKPGAPIVHAAQAPQAAPRAHARQPPPKPASAHFYAQQQQPLQQPLQQPQQQRHRQQQPQQQHPARFAREVPPQAPAHVPQPAARASPAPAMSGGAPPGAQLAYPGAPAHASSGGGVHTSVRVHKDGSAINSSQMEAALNPARNDRDAMRRAGLHPHNHHRDNVSKIREKQQEVAAKKAFESQAAQRTDDQRRRARELAAATAQRASTAGAVASDASRAAKQPASQQTVGRHESYGKVPTYLAERNRAKEAEETLAREEAAKRASCPPGTRLVTEDERTAVLATIAAREAELRKELNALPFVTKTLSTANRKKALEDRLEEIEGARAQYSKPRVYVALDV